MDSVLNNHSHIRVDFADPEVGRIFMHSGRAAREFKDYPLNLRQAISIGRRTLHPIAEIAACWYKPASDRNAGDLDMGADDALANANDILSMQLHPLQKMVPQALLLAALEKTLVQVVNEVGVELNDIVNRPHLQAQLSFVAGLGEHKASALLSYVQRKGFQASRGEMQMGEMQFQAMLQSDIDINDPTTMPDGLGPVVYKNCAGFLLIHAQTANLDKTRIHPDNYVLANNVILDALEESLDSDGEEEGEEDKIKHQQEKLSALTEKIMRPSQFKRLDELDLEAYAKILEEEGDGKKADTLRLIADELKGPFFKLDGYGRQFVGPPADKMFEWMTGETDETLRPNLIVDAQVQSTRNIRWVGVFAAVL